MKQLPVIQNPAQTPPAPATSSRTDSMTIDPEKTAALKPRIIEAVSSVFDPEIPVNIYELGLIYDILVDHAGVVGIRMTLTAPGCPAAQSLPVEVRNKVASIPGVTE